MALRDAIEHIVLDFPGYGYRRVTHVLFASCLENQPETGASDHGDHDYTINSLRTSR
ncbi:hypothetical protein KSF_005270 [Reticulibacter mediterranei]|uniref:Uncharacterized protein n=1 Tax=Reticulibacter mediterranei TaxID=2778369 RepID=A0A8J3I7W8_9CHLR|nr:hypothetical protein [Reticulibacter mediterranei]GHO90479.1 hypothetical protein KSF_005270 [Reticulibacter mediterranei]